MGPPRSHRGDWQWLLPGRAPDAHHPPWKVWLERSLRAGTMTRFPLPPPCYGLGFPAEPTVLARSHTGSLHPWPNWARPPHTRHEHLLPGLPDRQRTAWHWRAGRRCVQVGAARGQECRPAVDKAWFPALTLGRKRKMTNKPVLVRQSSKHALRGHFQRLPWGSPGSIDNRPPQKRMTSAR